MKNQRLEFAAIVLALMTVGAAAQEPAPAPNTDGVSLRDFLSNRIEQNRTDILDRVDNDVKTLRLLIDERDRLYNERADAQTKALQDTLAATKESADKAAAELTKRFDSVNEFRNTLSDQAGTFISKDETKALFVATDVRFKAMEDNINKNAAKLDDMQSRAAGASSLWAIIAGVAVLVLAIGGFTISAIRRQQEKAK